MKRFLLSLLSFLLLLNLTLADALSPAKRWYQIEVIVFSHITEQSLMSEKWSWTPTQFYPSPQTIQFNSDPTQAYSLLPKSAFVLAVEQRQLEKHPQYHVLLHLAWRQKIAVPREAKPIHIYGGSIYDSSGKVIGSAQYGQQPYNAHNIWQLNGTITSSLIRYIDMKFNLLFAEPTSKIPRASQLDNVQGRFAYFRLKQDRRMRSQELNYIGHPLYGILVKIVPVSAT